MIFSWFRRQTLLGLTLKLLVIAMVVTGGVVVYSDETSLSAVADRIDEFGPLFSPDTDSDRLDNAQENSTTGSNEFLFRDASYDKKDLYVVVIVGQNQEPLTQREVNNLKKIFANMPVDNPDNSTGINLHITQRSASRAYQFSSDPADDRLTQLYTRHLTEQEHCAAHMVILGSVEGEPEGYGDAPGYGVVVDGGSTRRYRTEYTVRTVSIVHELLHNVVGEFDDGTIHTQKGWLNGHSATHGSEFFMSSKTENALDSDGFSNSEYYQQEVC